MNTNPTDVALCKIYVARLPSDIPADKLLVHFSMYGEIEEGSLGFDKQTGKSKGFAMFNPLLLFQSLFMVNSLYFNSFI